MSYTTYKVTVHVDGAYEWRLNGERHREDGPAIEYSDIYSDSDKSWYINGTELTEAEFNARNSSHEGKVVVVDGVEYELKKR